MRTGRIGAIDLLRGVAVLLVMLRHGLPSLFPGAGVVGIVMFFSLSGYVITGVLLDEVSRTGSVSLRHFYARRAARLVPALLLLLVGFTTVTLLLDPLADRDTLPSTWAVALTWTANLPGRPVISDAAFHLWTLAGEEQFYLVWPAFLVAGLGRGWGHAIWWIAGVTAFVGLLATMLWLREVPENAYVLPTSWACCFVIGATARALRERLGTPAAPVLLLAGVVLAGLSLLPVRGHLTTYVLVGPSVALAAAALMLAAHGNPRVPTLARPLVQLGLVSYSAYLWNYPLTLWLRPFGLAGALGAAVLTVLLATLSWRVVERPFERAVRRRLQSGPPVVRTHERVPE